MTLTAKKLQPHKLTLRIATASARERQEIARIRYQVFAEELSQYPKNVAKRLTDPLDEFNAYIVATVNNDIAGFISITPPGHSYSIDKYLDRTELPIEFHDNLYEARILTVAKPFRKRGVGAILMYAAIRWIRENGGTELIILGRHEVLEMYTRVGLRKIGRQITAGSVVYELMFGKIEEIQQGVSRALPKLEAHGIALQWDLDLPIRPSEKCFHGGAFFDALGTDFQNLSQRHEIINADVLDAWFPPSPKVLAALKKDLEWIVRTSPPISPEGLTRIIRQARGIPAECVYPSSGATSLIYKAWPKILTSKSKVLLLDPTYGEYAHHATHIAKCQIVRLPLHKSDGFRIDPDAFEKELSKGYDLVVIVNPNNPTGMLCERRTLEKLIAAAPKMTTFWIDETYIDYASPDASVERFAAKSENVIICKSMSKAYALSGLRVGYLCAGAKFIAMLNSDSQPWEISLPGQIAAVEALQDPGYYQSRYRETAELRADVVKKLTEQNPGISYISGATNFILCFLPDDGPSTKTVIENCREHGLFLRDVSNMGQSLGNRAFRIAVKDAATNARVVRILTQVLTHS